MNFYALITRILPSIASFVVVTLALVPLVTFAEDPFPGIVSFAGCSGPDCSACNIVNMVNGGIQWLISILFVIFAVLLAWRGVQLVTSAGNPSALSAVKEAFVNAFIGILIILSAWLIVDTIMRGLVGVADEEGVLPVVVEGRVTGWLAWSKVECQDQTEPNLASIQTFWPGSEVTGLGNSSVTTTVSCAATPAGNRNCTQAEADCRTRGGSPWTDTSNPDNYQVNCVAEESGVAPVAGSGSAGCAGGTCVPLTIPCARASSCTIAPEMVSRLADMHAQANVAGARVTEAMPPSRTHRSACHTNGTCIDYSKSGGMTGAEVARVIAAARANGLRPVYEVVTQAQKDALVADGAPAGDIKVLGSWISAPHFSIYAN